MNTFIAELEMVTNKTNSEEFKRVNDTHADYYRPLIAEGKFLMSGPALDKDGQVNGRGVFIILAKNRLEAEHIMSNDPMVIAGFSKYTLKEFQPMLINPVLKDFLNKEER